MILSNRKFNISLACCAGKYRRVLTASLGSTPRVYKPVSQYFVHTSQVIHNVLKWFVSIMFSGWRYVDEIGCISISSWRESVFIPGKIWCTIKSQAYCRGQIFVTTNASVNLLFRHLSRKFNCVWIINL